jgi:leucyl aminopeptidase
MIDTAKPVWPKVDAVYAQPKAKLKDARKLWLADGPNWADEQALSNAQTAWLAAQNFAASSRRPVLVPGGDGELAGIALGTEAHPRDPMQRAEVLVGLVPPSAPKGSYAVAGNLAQPELASIAWGLGAYKFGRYKAGGGNGEGPRLHIPANANAGRVKAIVEAIWFGRDLVNTPANDLGPAELEAAARLLAEQHKAAVKSVVGDDLLTRNFPMIHAVGRASPRAPRLIDITWNGHPDGRRITLVGKGICFDTGGLDIKPASGMVLMKKDMGGAAAALALAHMIMAAKLPVRLRVLLAVAENAIAGDAFRPGDVLRARNGQTVEIGNTDAEGRLVLADALALADEEKPDVLISLATLTGAARTAVGPELAPFYCDDDALAASLQAAGHAVADPLWRMPFWTPYEIMFDSAVADMNNVSEGAFAGSIIAALFLRKFVRQAKAYAHFDIYGWRPSARPLGPRGGEVQAARALFEALRLG